VQRYFCVMDALGPRVEGPCLDSADCPPGMRCTLGNCVPSGDDFCCTSADCDAGLSCQPRVVNQAQTGLCQ
jgi:hypothetical protein